MTQSIQQATNINEITGEIVDCCFRIHKSLGPGLLERVYEDCLCYELQQRNILFERQKSLSITYERLTIDDAFRLDLLVNGDVIVELKSIENLLPIHEAQILTYMKLTNMRLGLLINFNVPLIKNGIRRFKL